MLRSLALSVLLALPGGAPATSAPGAVVRVDAGEARVAVGREVRSLDARSGALALGEASAWVESSAGSRIELVWRGLASATLQGPSSFQVERAPGLRLSEVAVLELEVRRGKLALEIADIGSLELGAGALQLRSLPDGVVELLNRGGAPLALKRAGEKPLEIVAGQRVRVRPLPRA